MAETKGMAEIQTRYPVTDGITAGTTTQKGHKERLEAEEGSSVRQIDRVGL